MSQGRPYQHPINPTSSPFNAIGDGVVDDTVAIQRVMDVGHPAYFPPGTFKTTFGSADHEGPFFGAGQVQDLEGLRGKYFSAVKSRPSSLGDYDSGVINAFSGDLRKVQFAIEHRITGAGTLGIPSGAYLYTPETAAFFEQFYIGPGAGYNGSHTTAANRTGGAYRYRGIRNSSVGDGIGDVTIGFADGVDPDATGPLGYLANSAVSHRGGTNTAGAHGVYLQVEEVNHNDGGYDVSSLHFNARSNRTNDDGVLGTWWGGFLSESEGSKRINSGYALSGLHRVGYDAVRGDTLASFAQKEDDKFALLASSSGGYLYTTDLGDTYLSASASGGKHVYFVVNGGTAFYISDTNIAAPLGGIYIKQGMTAPGAIAGLSVLYVDTADGLLKRKKADGSVKIVTET